MTQFGIALSATGEVGTAAPDEQFGFTVMYDEADERWRVSLPHQCDRWDITDYFTGHDRAVAQMEAFVAEAQAALERLRAKTADELV